MVKKPSCIIYSAVRFLYKRKWYCTSCLLHDIIRLIIQYNQVIQESTSLCYSSSIG